MPRSVVWWYARVRAEGRPRRVFVGVGPAARPLSTAGAPVEERGVVVCRPSISGCRGYTPCMCLGLVLAHGVVVLLARLRVAAGLAVSRGG